MTTKLRADVARPRGVAGLNRYVVAAVAVVVTLVIRLALDPFLGDESPLLAFVVAIAIAGLFGGLGAGLFATGLSAVLGDFFFVGGRFQFGSLSVTDVVRMGLFISEGIAISFLAGLLRRKNEALEVLTIELKESNDALNTFVRTVSHDLRAPLRSMSGYAEILSQDFSSQLSPQGRDYAVRLTVASHSLDNMVNNLLEYTRLERVDPASEVASLDRVMQGVVRHLADEIRQTGGRIEVQADLGEVIAHPATLELILVNLVANGLKFVEPGRMPVVSVRSMLRGGTRRITVRDNGIGVAAGKQAAIFQPFVRLNTEAIFVGSGLGLALVARGATRMGGACGVDSDGASGSEFWIELPEAHTGGSGVGSYSDR